MKVDCNRAVRALARRRVRTVHVGEDGKYYTSLHPSDFLGNLFCFTCVPMIHQCFDEVVVLGERFLSRHARGKHSATICAFWCAPGGVLSNTCDQLRVGVVYSNCITKLYTHS